MIHPDWHTACHKVYTAHLVRVGINQVMGMDVVQCRFVQVADRFLHCLNKLNVCLKDNVIRNQKEFICEPVDNQTFNDGTLLFESNNYRIYLPINS